MTLERHFAHSKLFDLEDLGEKTWGHFPASGLPGQYFALLKIQSMASASVAKSPI
jgi:hypothetical protein